MKKKLTAIFLCVALLAIAIVGATLAYFTDTKSATNTFTVGNVKIDLIESRYHRQGSGGSGDTSIPAPTQTASGMKYVSDGATIFTDEEIKAAADALLEKGVSKVVVTLGARGAMLADGNEKLFFEAKPVVPVDTTAAGAAFTAAMVNGLAQEMGMIQAIRMANGVASIVVTRHGAQASIPDRDEIDDLIWNY